MILKHAKHFLLQVLFTKLHMNGLEATGVAHRYFHIWSTNLSSIPPGHFLGLQSADLQLYHLSHNRSLSVLPRPSFFIFSGFLFGIQFAVVVFGLK